MKKLVLLLTILLILILNFAGIGQTQDKKLMYFGSVSTSSSGYAYCIAAARVINQANPNLTVTVIETGGAIDNIKRMGKKQIEIALSTSDASYQAYNGLGQWKGNPQEDLRLLWVVVPLVQNIVVRADSGVKTLQDLEGKPFSPGSRGSGTESVIMQVFELLNIKPKYIRGGLSDAVDGIKDGRSTGYAKSGVGTEMLDATTLDLATFTAIRIIGFNEKELEIVKKSLPFINEVVVPAGIVKGMPEYKSICLTNEQIGSKELSSELAYNIFKAVATDKTEQVAANPALKGANFIENLLKYGKIPLHKGVIKYVLEKGHKVPDQLIPPETK